MKGINKKEVGTRIKSIRQSKGLTQEEFGKYFGASKGNVATWEKGSSLPNNERIKMIAKFGSIEVDELLHGDAFSFLISKLDEMISSEYSYLKNMVPLSAFRVFIEKLKDGNYNYSDPGSLADMINEMTNLAKINFEKTTVKYTEFILSNIDLAKLAHTSLQDYRYYNDKFNDFEEFIEYLQNVDKRKLSDIDNIIESFYVEMKFIAKHDFFFLYSKTYQTKLNDFINNKFALNSAEETTIPLNYKVSRNALQRQVHEILVIYNPKNELAYSVPIYEEGYVDYEYEKKHLVIFENEIHVAPMLIGDVFEINKNLIEAGKVQFFLPLLAIYY